MVPQKIFDECMVVIAIWCPHCIIFTSNILKLWILQLVITGLMMCGVPFVKGKTSRRLDVVYICQTTNFIDSIQLM